MGKVELRAREEEEEEPGGGWGRRRARPRFPSGSPCGLSASGGQRDARAPGTRPAPRRRQETLTEAKICQARGQT